MNEDSYRFDCEGTHEDQSVRRRTESRLFIFLVVFLFPTLSIIVVGGYGFLVWMYQLLAGPPGPPG